MNDKAPQIELLVSQGWVRRFVASDPRLSEAVDAYVQAGFEVHLEPFTAGHEMNGAAEGQDRGCEQCFKGLEDQCKIIFTRARKGAREPDPHVP